MALPVSRFPALKPDRVLRLLRQVGYQKVRQRGSHILLRAEGRQTITLSMHKGRTVKPKHLRAMLVERVGLTEDEIEALL
ncbi:type II toxin-antitoxin system HicA family toxin [Candidatus Poriferisodalis sp.]|uniref:type II toxin-antitoxin system HicA family toxin n=1 Tax=Candidatus Poriferisodalis sp. TaxID=3101277 RepID=UPI003B028FAE